MQFTYFFWHNILRPQLRLIKCNNEWITDIKKKDIDYRSADIKFTSLIRNLLLGMSVWYRLWLVYSGSDMELPLLLLYKTGERETINPK